MTSRAPAATSATGVAQATRPTAQRQPVDDRLAGLAARPSRR